MAGRRKIEPDKRWWMVGMDSGPLPRNPKTASAVKRGGSERTTGWEEGRIYEKGEGTVTRNGTGCYWKGGKVVTWIGGNRDDDDDDDALITGSEMIRRWSRMMQTCAIGPTS
jgi:hypothetical protein